MSTKVCSQCQQARANEDYSGAQLKKKGKRVCTPCLTGAEPTPIEGNEPPTSEGNHEQPSSATTTHATSSNSSTTTVTTSSSTSLLVDSSTVPRLPAGTIVPACRLPTLSSGSYPPNRHFPTTSPIAYEDGIAYYTYASETQLPLMTKLIERDLSEPYSIFTYRFFVNFWPELAIMAMVDDECIGCVICRLEVDKQNLARGYIAMLAVSTLYRKRQIGTKLVKFALHTMRESGADLCMLEAETTNPGALALYDKLNFVRETRLVKYYLSGSDAFRLKLWFSPHGQQRRRPIPQIKPTTTTASTTTTVTPTPNQSQKEVVETKTD